MIQGPANAAVCSINCAVQTAVRQRAPLGLSNFGALVSLGGLGGLGMLGFSGLFNGLVFDEGEPKDTVDETVI